jgi:hypothetical protein
MPLYTEEDETNALNALVNGEHKSIHRAALVFQIPTSTLRHRFRNRKTNKESHVSQQILTPIEESTLENWIYRAAKLGAPITIKLVKILASEIQSERSSIAFGHDTPGLRRVSRVLSTQRGLRHLIFRR